MRKRKPIASEADLVAACSQNQRAAQEQLYRQYAPAMVRMINRYVEDEGTVMHILNASFLRVFKKIGTFEHKGSLEGWIRRLVFHALSDYFRNRKPQLHFLELEERDKAAPVTALPNLYLDDLLGLIRKLPPMAHKVFQLYAIEGFTHREIAQTLNISEGTSKWQLSAARKRLRELLDEQDKQEYYAG